MKVPLVNAAIEALFVKAALKAHLVKTPLESSLVKAALEVPLVRVAKEIFFDKAVLRIVKRKSSPSQEKVKEKVKEKKDLTLLTVWSSLHPPHPTPPHPTPPH